MSDRINKLPESSDQQPVHWLQAIHDGINTAFRTTASDCWDNLQASRQDVRTFNAHNVLTLRGQDDAMDKAYAEA